MRLVAERHSVRWTRSSGKKLVIEDIRSLGFPELARAEIVGVVPLGGGLNHGVFGIETTDGRCCLKLYSDSARQQLFREWWALQKLGPLGLAPQPFGFVGPDQRVPHGAILMEWVQGEPLSSIRDSQSILKLLLPVAAAIHDVALAAGETEWLDEYQPHQGPRSWLDGRVAQYRRAQSGVPGALREEEKAGLERLIEQTEDVVRRAVRLPERLALCHSDPSLANVVIGPTGQVRCVDWEYCGRGDPAYEFADYVHHPMNERVPRSEWLSALATYPPAVQAPTFRERFAVYDVLVAVGWCLRFAVGITRSVTGTESRPGKSGMSYVEDTRRRLLTYLRRTSGWIDDLARLPQ